MNHPGYRTDFAKLPDDELLEIALRSEDRALEVLQIASIDSIMELTREQLGLSKLQHDRLLASIELGRRISEVRSQYEIKAVINSPQAAIDYCRAYFARLIADGMQEEFHVVTLNTKLHVLRSHLVTRGTLDASLVHPREVFRAAIKDSAAAVLLAHNHPSRDPAPSIQDRQITHRLEQVGETLGINVVDHIVMSRAGCVSLRQHSL